MKRLSRTLSLAALIGATLTSASHLDTNNYSLHVGPIFNFARYKFGDLSKTEGYLAGIHTDMIHKHSCNVSTRLMFDGRWNAGFISGINDRKAKIKDYRPELDFCYKFNIGNCKQLSLIPFIGTGFYFLSTKLSTEDVTRKFYNLYIPLGAQLTWKLPETHFDIGIAAKYRLDAWTRLKLTTPELGSTGKIKLHRTQGLLIEMPMTWHHHNLCRDLKFHTKIVPFFDWNRFGSSKQVNNNHIPVPTGKVQQWYLGLHADVGIHF